MRASVAAYSSNSIKAKTVISWLEPYSTESEFKLRSHTLSFPIVF